MGERRGRLRLRVPYLQVFVTAVGDAHDDGVGPANQGSAQPVSRLVVEDPLHQLRATYSGMTTKVTGSACRPATSIAFIPRDTIRV